MLRWLIIAVGLAMAGGTLLNLSSHPHWFVRGWDFPRVHAAAIAAASGLLYAAFYFEGHWLEWAFFAATGACVAWHIFQVFPYTPLAPNQVKRASSPDPDCTVRLLICNVLMQNKKYDKLLNVIHEVDPDLVLLVEVDEGWVRAMRPIEKSRPNTILQPQDNMYGMAFYSRFPLENGEVKFRVQEDIPSIEVDVELPCGAKVRMHGLHPRPPEPIRDQDATPRDAELVVVGREIEHEDRPTIVAGDLNDVAWSPTTRLFLKLSGLLDPRLGRGFYNTFNANHPYFRFPLDHVFHTNSFKLIELQRLPNVGSDHFPVFIALHYEPEAEAEQPEPEPDAADEQEADEKLERAAEDPNLPKFN